MPIRPFVDYYRILEVSPRATAQEIRRSFRRLVLQAHPDKNRNRIDWSERRIRELIQAFDIIGNSEKRRRFDAEYEAQRIEAESRKRKDPSSKIPRESEYFFFKRSDPRALAFRILYFLLHGRGEEAVLLLARCEGRSGPGFLREKLNRADYLDCLFLLGEFHLGRHEYREALERLKALYLHEVNVRNPRHYIDAVVAHLKDLYLRKIPKKLPPAEALRYLREALELRLGPREKLALERLMEELEGKLSREEMYARGGRGATSRRRE